MCSTINI